MPTKLKKPDSPFRQMGLVFEEDKQYYIDIFDLMQLQSQTFALDIESTGLAWYQDTLLGVGVFCPKLDIAGFVQTNNEQERQTAKRIIAEIASSPETFIIGHNFKFDANFLDLESWKLPFKIADTTVLAHLYDSRLSKALGNLEATFLKTETKALRAAKGIKGALAKDLAPGVLAEYCTNDCRVTFRLYEVLFPLIQQLKLEPLFWQQMDYLKFLQRVERRGMVLDLEFVHRAMARMEKNLADMEKELFEKSKHPPFNWRSDSQLSKVLYDHMGVPRPKNPFADADGVDRSRFALKGRYNKTMTSTFLLMEKAGHPLGSHVQDMRESDKLHSNLVEWLNLIDKNNVIHTSFNATGTRTGRLSSSKPNLQNVASDVRVRYTQSVYSGGALRSDEYNLRIGLVPRPGFSYLSIDFRQQEMRMFAIMAQEPLMMDALRRREDIHAMIAKAVWPKDIEKDPSVLPVRREWSKTIAFGIIYGMTTGSLQMRLNKTQEEAKQIVGAYMARFPRIKPFLQECINHIKKQGYVRYWSGRIWREEQEIEAYKSANALVQGGSADLMAVAAMRCQEWLDKHSPESCIVNIIHDELLFEVPTGEVEALAPQLIKIMEVEDLLGIPFATEAKWGHSFGNMQKLKEPAQ